MYLKADVNSVCGCRREGGGDRAFRNEFLTTCGRQSCTSIIASSKIVAFFFRYTVITLSYIQLYVQIRDKSWLGLSLFYEIFEQL